MRHKHISDWDTPLGRNIRRNTPQNVRVTIEEKRASTDESVRLLAEMEKAATGRILQRIDLASNTLKAKVVVFEEMGTNSVVVRILCDLNGVRNDWTVKCDRHDFADRMKFVAFVQKEIADRLSWHLMQEVVKIDAI